MMGSDFKSVFTRRYPCSSCYIYIYGEARPTLSGIGLVRMMFIRQPLNSLFLMRTWLAGVHRSSLEATHVSLYQ